MTPYLSVVIRFAETLDDLGIPYAIVGSVASSAHGEARATADADFIVDMSDDQAVALVERLAGTHYIDLASIRRAISQQRSFNAIELATMFKLDVFVAGRRARARRELENARRAKLASDVGDSVLVASPEDTVVAKLRWFRRGGEVSEKQWTDVLGVLRVQHGRLDSAYLAKTADEERVLDLLEKALAQVEGEDPSE